MRHGVPCGSIGADADKGGLAERCQAGDAGHQHETKCCHRIDADIVHQRDGEAAEDRWRDGNESDRNEHDQAGTHTLHVRLSPSSSSTSSTTPPRVANDCHKRIGMSEPKTITSLSALFQNDA